jgi:riboflavin biosynthesis pyrimidine reductase
VEPFDVLAEEAGLPAVVLPSELSRIYGGDLSLPDESVYANFVATLDGVVAIPGLRNSNSVIADESDPDRFLMGVLRAFADAVLVGAGVLRASPKGTWRAESIYPPAAESYSALRRQLELPEAPEIAVLTGVATIDRAHPVLSGRAVVLTGDEGAGRLAGNVPETADVVSLGAGHRFDGATIVAALRARGHRRILCEAGPHTFGALLDAEQVDELFLTTSPYLAGDAGDGSRFRLVEAADLVPLIECKPLSIRRHGAHLFTRFAVGQRDG